MISEEQLTGLITWLAESALAGESELRLVIGFCERAVAAGLPLARVRVLIDTLDPVHEGRVFRWGYDATVPPEQDYGRTTPIVASGHRNQALCRMQRLPQRGAADHFIGCVKPMNS